MNDTTLTIRTDKKLKKDAIKYFDNIGISLSQGINLFLMKTIKNNRMPFVLDFNEIEETNVTNNYSKEFWSLFGSCRDVDMTIEPEDIPINHEETF